MIQIVWRQERHVASAFRLFYDPQTLRSDDGDLFEVFRRVGYHPFGGDYLLYTMDEGGPDRLREALLAAGYSFVEQWM